MSVTVIFGIDGIPPKDPKVSFRDDETLKKVNPALIFALLANGQAKVEKTKTEYGEQFCITPIPAIPEQYLYDNPERVTMSPATWQESKDRKFKSPARTPNPEILKLEILKLEDERREMERQAQSAGSQYTIGVIGVIAGLALLVFTSVYWLGGLLFVAGALAVLTQGSKKRGAQKRIGALSAQIRDKRSDLARLLE